MSRPLLYLEPVGGISGDMFLAAALDLGVSLAALEEGLRTLQLPDWRLVTTQGRRHGLTGVHLEDLQTAQCIIAIAGMEGALPSVVAGLVSAPVVAVPTSVGYGAAFGGITALLAMLNSCSGGVGVVNIDNGFGAALLAYRIIRAGK